MKNKKTKIESKTSLHFLGASGSVTGSKYLVKTGSKQILVDCRLFEGLKKLGEINWDYLPVKISEIDTVLFTHGHLDHIGYVPRLIKTGYNGSVYGSSSTLAIAGIIL
jgi:metallo-beta-lactamase family protein